MIHRIKVGLSTGMPIADIEDELEVEIKDNATPAQIEKAKQQALEEWANNFIEYWYESLD